MSSVAFHFTTKLRRYGLSKQIFLGTFALNKKDKFFHRHSFFCPKQVKNVFLREKVFFSKSTLKHLREKQKNINMVCSVVSSPLLIFLFEDLQISHWAGFFHSSRWRHDGCAIKICNWPRS